MSLIRWQCWKIVEQGAGLWGRLLSTFLVLTIFASVGAEILSSLPDLGEEWKGELWLFDLATAFVFLAEYGLRIWVCVEDPRERFHGHPVAGRLRYMATPKGLIDLVAVLPLFLSLFLVGDFGFLKLARLLKLLRYSQALDTLVDVVKFERKVLLSAGIVMLVLWVLVSSLMYYIERDAQPQAFGSIPAAMWWGVVTLATVGYGDVVPHTQLGKLIGGFSAVAGLCMFALPAGILASAFSQEMKKRDFVITWTMVAKVPLFSGLNAQIIADIAGLFAPKVAVPGERLVRKGDPADAMFLIVSGEVEVDVGEVPVRLKAGDFFGEIALLSKTARTATVRAVSSCQLLVLDSSDFESLLAVHPDLRETISRVAKQRMAEIEALG